MHHQSILLRSARLSFVFSGAKMLESYHDKVYSPPLSTPECDLFLTLCVQNQTAGGSTEDSISAALSVLHHMKQTSLPFPAVSTYGMATQCVLAQLKDGVPAHEVLMQLQQDVWQHMPAVRAELNVPAPYLAALNVFEGSQGVQTTLLMSLWRCLPGTAMCHGGIPPCLAAPHSWGRLYR